MGEKIVKNYNRVEKNSEIYKDIHDISIRTWWKIVLLNELNTPIVESFWNLGMLCLYGISLALILQGDASIDAGTVVAFTSYMGLFSGPLTQIAAIIQNLSSVTSNLEQVFDTIDTQVQINDSENSDELTHVKARVDFKHVSFDDAAFGCEKLIHLQDGNGQRQSLKVNIPAGFDSAKTVRLIG